MKESHHTRIDASCGACQGEIRQATGLLRTLEVLEACTTNLISNDYFQLRSHPQVIEGAKTALDRYGASSSATVVLYTVVALARSSTTCTYYASLDYEPDIRNDETYQGFTAENSHLHLEVPLYVDVNMEPSISP